MADVGIDLNKWSNSPQGLVDAMELAGEARTMVVLARDVRLGAANSAAIANALKATRLEELWLVSDSTAVGFFASSLSFRVPLIAIHTEQAQTERVIRWLEPVSPRTSDAATPMPVVDMSEGEPDDVAARLRKAVQALGSETVALRLSPGRRLSPDAVRFVAAALSDLGLRELVLVQASPVVGFLASALGLQLAHCRVRSVKTVDMIG